MPIPQIPTPAADFELLLQGETEKDDSADITHCSKPLTSEDARLTPLNLPLLPNPTLVLVPVIKMSNQTSDAVTIKIGTHESDRQERTLPPPATSSHGIHPAPPQGLHPAFYIATWIFCSSSVILFNKWILHTLNFPFPIFLTTCHLLFATIATRLLRKTTTLLNGVDEVKMDWSTFARTVVPIGIMFSISLIFSNKAYLYLTVSYIQMLKATTPVAVLVAGYIFKTEKYDPVVLGKVCIIVFGVVLASYGEFEFVLVGFTMQAIGIAAEATRLVMVQKLLKDYKMDPLVSLYFFAP
ncbi:hypothetical protein HDU96_001223, partial [Phlyctochytrium bullatum]